MGPLKVAMSDKDHVLPIDADERKATPIFSGVMNYFPLALAAVARHSKMGNDQHNPGQPLHWSRGKSTDHENCIARHLIDAHTVDPSTGEHVEARALAWRALALLQEIEERRLGKPISRGCQAPKDDTIHVVVGVLIDRRGRILFQRRPLSDENFPGAWECPGGGIEPGETDKDALLRELGEELGIVVGGDGSGHPIAELIWRGQIAGYKGGRHDFRFYEVRSWIGTPKAVDGQPALGWYSIRRPPTGLTPANLLAWPDIVQRVLSAKGRSR